MWPDVENTVAGATFRTSKEICEVVFAAQWVCAKETKETSTALEI